MHQSPVTSDPRLSLLAAWFALVTLSIRRQARVRQMVWLALALLIMVAGTVTLVSQIRGWKLTNRRTPFRTRMPVRTNEDALRRAAAYRALLPATAPATAAYDAAIGAAGTAMDKSGFPVFARWVVFSIFQSFLLPLWTLSFSTDALGNERESRTLLWLTTRPMPKPAIYLAKYVSLLPWAFAVNLGGFAVICAAGGEPGWLAMRLYWPAILGGTMAFAALFHLFAALFRRPAVLGLVYAFFFETLVGDMPGDMKRLSINFYIRSLMYHATEPLNVEAGQLSVYAPVTGLTAWGVLAGVTAGLLLLGMWYFSWAEYGEDV